MRLAVTKSLEPLYPIWLTLNNFEELQKLSNNMHDKKYQLNRMIEIFL